MGRYGILTPRLGAEVELTVPEQFSESTNMTKIEGYCGRIYAHRDNPMEEKKEDKGNLGRVDNVTRAKLGDKKPPTGQSPHFSLGHRLGFRAEKWVGSAQLISHQPLTSTRHSAYPTTSGKLLLWLVV